MFLFSWKVKNKKDLFKSISCLMKNSNIRYMKQSFAKHVLQTYCYINWHAEQEYEKYENWLATICFSFLSHFADFFSPFIKVFATITRTQMRVMMLIRNHLEPFRKLKAFWTIWNHLKPFGAIWKHLEPFGTIWNDLELFGTI